MNWILSSKYAHFFYTDFAEIKTLSQRMGVQESHQEQRQAESTADSHGFMEIRTIKTSEPVCIQADRIGRIRRKETQWVVNWFI